MSNNSEELHRAQLANSAPLIVEDRVVAHPHMVHKRRKRVRGRGIRLGEGELIVAGIRPRWTSLLPALLVVSGVVVFATFDFGNLQPIFDVLRVIGIVGSITLVIVAIASWRNDEMLLTTERLVHTKGLFGRQTREIPLTDVADTNVKQDFVERLIGAGSIRIDVSSGEAETLAHISDPSAFQELLVEQVEKNAKELFSSAPRGNDHHDSLGDLERLYSLYEKGAIDADEYARAKQRLLRDL